MLRLGEASKPRKAGPLDRIVQPLRFHDRATRVGAENAKPHFPQIDDIAAVLACKETLWH